MSCTELSAASAEHLVAPATSRCGSLCRPFAAKVDTRKAARKARQKRLNGSVDGRSLRATGRTEHLNFKALPEIKEAGGKAAGTGGGAVGARRMERLAVFEWPRGFPPGATWFRKAAFAALLRRVEP